MKTLYISNYIEAFNYSYEKSKIKVAKSLIVENEPLERILRLTGLTKQEIEELMK